MVKQLKYLGPGSEPDPIRGIASAIVLVRGLNGHEPDDEEIRECLELEGLEPSADNIELVQRSVAQLSNGSLDDWRRGGSDG